ncbi:MAG TPA: hypothetical protein VLJ61_00040 [Pyrinomonadaceae bacterium]|nr:hypothetical protein [Pyrinomonadaceae bacterium]
MFIARTTIEKMTARCPAPTEPLVARMRLGHVLQSTDLAPPGFPPQAILFIRRVAAPAGVALDNLSLRPQWERATRETLARMWARAARPVAGRVPAWAEAVLFQDIGEWLACLGVAVERRQVEEHWCWRASLGASAATSSSRTLTRVWIEHAHFVPAAIAHLAEWSEAARTLALLQPEEARSILSALGSGLGLPRALTSPDTDVRPTSFAQVEDRALRRARLPESNGWNSAKNKKTSASSDEFDEALMRVAEAERAAPWRHWIPNLDSECERLNAPAQRLLSVAVAAFHAPAVARSRGFAEEVLAFIEAPRGTNRSDDAAKRTGRQQKNEAAGGKAKRVVKEAAQGFSAAPAAFKEDEKTSSREGADAHAQTPLAVEETETDVESPAFQERTRPAVHEHAAQIQKEAHSSDGVAVEDESGAEEAEPSKTWSGLDGFETALGGVLFLLNLFMHLRLPECFDEDFDLSEHLSGWGIAELLARAMLGDAFEKYASDPLWEMLARLEGRSAGESPAGGLVVRDSYRIPAHWLVRFAEGEAMWEAREANARLVIEDARGFVVSEQPLGERTFAKAATEELEHFRALGVEARLLEDVAARALAATSSTSDSPASLARGRLPAFGRAKLSEGLRRWMSWTAPFMFYALKRALACGDERDFEEAAFSLLSRRGRLFCTKTHVDLLMEMGRVSLAARRAGLDASPGWTQDLMRVVSFHFE